MATLLKAGVVGAQYHNQELTAPTHPQARSIFDGAQEFRRASFQLLPEVDWRRASELCSSLFGVQGGDTFERTAAIVHEQAVQWERKAGQLGVRCRDNSLPDEFAATCQRAVQALGDIIRLADPNVRLRRFMESVNLLQQQIPLVRRLEGFNFDQYRTARAFVQEVSDWATRLPDEAARRWEQLRGGIGATALLERWHQTYQDYVFLLARYRSDYSRAHREFQESFRQALKSVQQHEAFQRELSKAEQVSEPLRALLCEADDPTPTEETSRCPACLRPFVGLSASVLADVGRQVEEALDALLPRPTPERIAPLSISRAIVSEEELQGLASELRRYWRRAQGPLQVRVYAEPAEPRP